MLPPHRILLALLVISSTPLLAQTPASAAGSDTTLAVDNEGVRLGLQFGVLTGAFGYHDGRSEQSLGALVRWAPTRWFALSTSPAGVRSTTPPVTGTRPVSRSGLVDLPVSASLSHHFSGPLAPVVSGGLGISLPTGDTASGFGSGRTGSSAEVGMGITPSDAIWLSIGAGRSLAHNAAQSAFTSGAGWGDVSAGLSVSEHASLEAGCDTDLGPLDDPNVGRSTSVSAGIEYAVHGSTMLNLTSSHGLSGIAPKWSVAVGIGTAFPTLGHAEAAPLRKAFGSSNAVGLKHRPR